MRGEVVRIVLVPRFTAFAGGTDTEFLTPPLNVKEFAEAVFALGQGVGAGDPPDLGWVRVQFQQSTDLENWSDVGAAFPSAAPSSPPQEDVTQRQFGFEWIRAKVIVNGYITAWLVGDFVPRES